MNNSIVENNLLEMEIADMPKADTEINVKHKLGLIFWLRVLDSLCRSMQAELTEFIEADLDHIDNLLDDMNVN